MAPELVGVRGDVAVVGREKRKDLDDVSGGQLQERVGLDRCFQGGHVEDAILRLGAVLVEGDVPGERIGGVDLEFDAAAEEVAAVDWCHEPVIACVERVLVIEEGVVELDLGPGVGGDVIVEVRVCGKLRRERQLEPTGIPVDTPRGDRVTSRNITIRMPAASSLGGR